LRGARLCGLEDNAGQPFNVDAVFVEGNAQGGNRGNEKLTGLTVFAILEPGGGTHAL